MGGRWVLGALVAVAALAVTRVSRPPAIGSFEATPGPTQLTVRVGDGVPFAALADDALGISWSLGDTPVSHDARWTFVPGPQDIGRRTISVAVVGEDGLPRTRTWEVAVAAAVLPELVEVIPPPGAVALAANAPATFHCRARLPAVPGTSQLRFEWLVNGRVAFVDEHPGSGGASDFPLATAEPGSHRVALRVAEVGHMATAVEWTVEVKAPVRVAAAEPARAEAPPTPLDTSPPSGTALVEGIEVEGGASPAVHIRLSAPAASHSGTIPARDGAPSRIFVDLRGAQLGAAAAGVVAGTGQLLRVRSGQFDPGTARIVLEVAAAVPFTLDGDGKTLTIRLDPAPDTAGDAPPVRVAAAPPNPPPAIAPPTRPTAAPPPVATAPPPRVEPEPPPASAPPPPTPAHAARPALAFSDLPVVVVDAGHGGRDPGAAGVGGVLEKDVVLQVAQRLAALLPARFPVTVIMTRSDDSFIPIDGRLAMTGEAATLFLSLHANACADPAPRGLEIFYGGGHLRTASTQGGDPRAALLGRSLYRALSQHLGAVRHPAQPAAFGVLTRNHVPSALVEIAYLTHPEEAAQVQDPGYQEQLAEALADGVGTFLRATAPGL